MKIVFQIVFAVGAIASLLVVSHYIFLAIHKPQHLLRFIADLEKTTKGKIYYGFLFIGSFAATYCGIKGLLFWLPASISSADVYSESPPLKDMLAGMLALFSLPMIGSVEEFARSKVRRRYLEKENEELKSLLTQLSGLKDKLNRYEELRKGSVDPDEQFLYARLQELGHRLGAQMSTLLKATIFEEKRKREEQLEREAKQSEATKRKTEIACQLYNYRNALDVATNRDRFEIVRSLEHVANGALCLIDPIFVMQKWQALERTAASVLSLSDKEIQNGTKTPFSINGLFETFVGISVVAPLTVMAAYSGDIHGGNTALYVEMDGQKQSFLKALRLENSIDALIEGLYTAFELSKKGAFWHGLYDHDYIFLFDNGQLIEVLRNQLKMPHDSSDIDKIDRPCGIRLSKSGCLYRVSCLAAFPNGTIVDLSASIDGGRLVAEPAEKILNSNSKIFY